MKKREQQSILIWFLSSIILFIIFLIIILNNVYPKIEQIENQKKDLVKNLEKYNILSNKWFDYEYFKELNTKYSNTKDSTLKELLNWNFYTSIYPQIDKNLYEQSIYFSINDKWEREYSSFEKFKINNPFLGFLDEKLDFFRKEKLSESFVNQKEKVTKVIPTYYSIWDNKKWLTDFSFINYIERLLNKFNLKTTSQIGIKELKQIEDNILNKNSSIYYVPINLKITGTKESVLNFLQYIKNSGDIILKNNDFKFSNKIGSTSQLSEVSSLKLNDYIDWSYKQRTIYYKDLTTYLKDTNQNEDIINVEVDLKFYVNTISSKKIIENINKIIGNLNKKIIPNKNENILDKNKKLKYELLHYNYNNLLTVAKSLRSNSLVNKNNFYKQKAENIYSYLNSSSLKKQILALKKEMKTTKNIDNLYKKALKYKEIFLKLDSEIYKIAKDLKIDTDQIDEKTKKIIQKWIYSKNYIFENK